MARYALYYSWSLHHTSDSTSVQSITHSSTNVGMLVPSSAGRAARPGCGADARLCWILASTGGRSTTLYTPRRGRAALRWSVIRVVLERGRGEKGRHQVLLLGRRGTRTRICYLPGPRLVLRDILRDQHRNLLPGWPGVGSTGHPPHDWDLLPA